MLNGRRGVSKVKRDEGSILLTVLVFLLIVVLLLGAGAMLASSGTRRIASVASRNQAHYLAETGIEKFLSDPVLLALFLSKQPSPPPSPSPIPVFERETIPDNEELGTYSLEAEVIDVDENGNRTLAIRSKGETPKATKIIEVTIVVKDLSIVAPFLDNVIATESGITGGKVYVSKGEGVTEDANVYSKGDIEIAGNIPGSVISSGGGITIDNKAVIEKDVKAQNNVRINNKAQIKGDVVSTNGTVTVNNNAEVKGSIWAYGTDSKGYSIYLSNGATVNNIYFKGKVDEKKSTVNGVREQLSPDATYPENLEKSLPQLASEMEGALREKAKGSTISFNGEPISGYVQGDFVVPNNARLTIPMGSIVFVEGKMEIANNATVDGGGIIVVGKNVVINNNAIPSTIAVIALHKDTSESSKIENSSASLGTFLILGDLKIKNVAQITGALFARNISDIGNNAEIIYQPNLVELLRSLIPSTESIQQVTDWKES